MRYVFISNISLMTCSRDWYESFATGAEKIQQILVFLKSYTPTLTSLDRACTFSIIWHRCLSFDRALLQWTAASHEKYVSGLIKPIDWGLFAWQCTCMSNHCHKICIKLESKQTDPVTITWSRTLVEWFKHYLLNISSAGKYQPKRWLKASQKGRKCLSKSSRLI